MMVFLTVFLGGKQFYETILFSGKCYHLPFILVIVFSFDQDGRVDRIHDAVGAIVDSEEKQEEVMNLSILFLNQKEGILR